MNFKQNFCKCKECERKLQNWRKGVEKKPTIAISPTTKMHSALRTHNQFPWFYSVIVIILKALCTIYTL